MEVRDCNGNTLADGDSVTVTKDLKVKGTSVTLKRGTRVRNILMRMPVDLTMRAGNCWPVRWS